MSAKITSIQLRRGTKAEWDQANSVLLDGEVGFETDTYRFKIGKRDEVSRELQTWSELRYAAPYSGDEKPVYPQTGDFYVESDSETASSSTIDYPGENLYYWNGEQWIRVTSATNPIFDGNVTINGPIDLSDGCFASDVLPCSDLTFDLGSPEKRWEELYVGSDDQGKIQFGSFEIKVGESSFEDSQLDRLQVNGDDIALRSDFRRYDTRDLNLFRTVDDEGNVLPTPRSYQQYIEVEAKTLPPETNLYTQAGFNEWTYITLQKIVGYPDNVAPPFGYEPPEEMTFFNKNVFKNEFVAEEAVQVPIVASNVNDRDIDESTYQSQHFLKADGTVSNRVPLVQSYWTDVPHLRNPRPVSKVLSRR